MHSSIAQLASDTVAYVFENGKQNLYSLVIDLVSTNLEGQNIFFFFLELQQSA